MGGLSKQRKEEVYLEIEYFYGPRCKEIDVTCVGCFMYYLADNNHWEPILRKFRENIAIGKELFG